jgi:hypothetical protein
MAEAASTHRSLTELPASSTVECIEEPSADETPGPLNMRKNPGKSVTHRKGPAGREPAAAPPAHKPTTRRLQW